MSFIIALDRIMLYTANFSGGNQHSEKDKQNVRIANHENELITFNCSHSFNAKFFVYFTLERNPSSFKHMIYSS